MCDRSAVEPSAEIASSLRALVGELDAALLTADAAVALVDRFTEIERLAVAGKTVALQRVAASEMWRADGDRSAADWLAKRTGSTVGSARAQLETASTLVETPGTDALMRAGTLSPAQIAAIAPAAAADPSAEARLLTMAQHESLQKLRDEAARVRAAADPDPLARHERIHTARSWRCFSRPDGSRSGMLTGTPEDVALFEAAARPFIDARLDAARAAGEREPSEAYAFDGVVAMARSTTEGGASAPPAARGGRGRKRLSERRELLAIVDLPALKRGRLESGETCEIPGVGPVPVEVARELFGDAVLRIVIRDGVDIRTVVHTGRTASALQETAVLVRDRGRCVRPQCGLPISEIDHQLGFEVTRRTTLDDLSGLCGSDHDLKTYQGHTYERDAAGRIVWRRPDGSEERERPPPR